jgi:sugar transferase (PEP-CTERM/EpsH1 system associated)
MKLLMITSRIPYPLEKGDKLRAYHQLRVLSKSHEITLVALTVEPPNPEAQKELLKYCKDVHFIQLNKFELIVQLIKSIGNALPFQVAYFNNRKTHQFLQQLTKMQPFDAAYFQLIRTAPYAKSVQVPLKILDYMDTFSKGMGRRLTAAKFWQKPIIRWEQKKLTNYENVVFNEFHKHTIISEQDRDLLPVSTKSSVAVVRNGVDHDYFSPDDTEKHYDILFNGNMNYPPNIESAVYLVHKIMPLVWKKIPTCRVLISGADPAEEVRALASDLVHVTGWVDDIRTSFRRSKILVAPMQSSIGLQNKLLEAMSCGLPCITTPLSNNALGAIPNQEIMVCSSPDDFAHSIDLLLNNSDQYQLLQNNGLKLVHQSFGWEGATAPLLNLLL